MAFDHSVYTHTSNTFHIFVIRRTYIYKVLLKVQIFLVVHFGSIAWECVIRVYNAIFGLKNVFVAWKGKGITTCYNFWLQAVVKGLIDDLRDIKIC